LSSSIVLAAPRILANNTSTPPSPSPQKALQKSRDRFCKIGELVLAYFESEVVEGCRLADIVWYSQDEVTWKGQNATKMQAGVSVSLA
jgi:hypothetical protein